MTISADNTRTNITIPKALKKKLEELAKGCFPHGVVGTFQPVSLVQAHSAES